MLKNRLSYSFASKLLSNPFELVAYQISNPTPRTDAMTKGCQLEYVLEHGLKDVLKYTETKTKGVKYDKFVTEAQIENDLYIENDFLIVTEGEYKMLELFSLSVSDEINEIVKASTSQIFFETDHYMKDGEEVSFGVPVAGVTDFVTEDYVYEMKVSDPAPKAFAKQVVNMNWDIQAFLYFYRAIEMNKKFAWIVISPKPPFTQRIYTLPDMRLIDSGQYKFERAIDLFKEFNSCNGVPSIHDQLEAPHFID